MLSPKVKNKEMVGMSTSGKQQACLTDALSGQKTVFTNTKQSVNCMAVGSDSTVVGNRCQTLLSAKQPTLL